VAAAVQDSEHSILLFEARTGLLLCRVKGGPRKVLNLKFSQQAGPVTLLQTGMSHFRVLKFDPKTRLLTSRAGSFGLGGPRPSPLCSAALPPCEPDGPANEFLLGLQDGTLAFLARS
jgi:hypothetical protein